MLIKLSKLVLFLFFLAHLQVQSKVNLLENYLESKKKASYEQYSKDCLEKNTWESCSDADFILITKLLNEEGINAYVINVSTIKPLKDPLICDIVNECKYFITAENHSVIGGLGDAIASFLNENKVQYFHSKVGLNDIFSEGASTDYLMKKYQMNFESIYKTSIDLIK